MSNELVIFEDGDVHLELNVQDESVWLTQQQIQTLLERERSVITKHINNIFKEGELEKEAVCAKFAHTAEDGKNYQVKHYNLDVIISVGYRVKSIRDTRFRQWATKVLKSYLLNGYALDESRLKKQKFDELEATLTLIKQNLKHELSQNESKGFVEIFTQYAKSWALLQGYDEASLEEIIETKKQKFILDYHEAKEAITLLKNDLKVKGNATELFGNEKANEFEGNLLSIYQSYGGV